MKTSPKEGHYCNVSIAGAVLLRRPSGRTPRVRCPLPASRLKFRQLKARQFVFCPYKVIGWFNKLPMASDLERKEDMQPCHLHFARNVWHFYLDIIAGSPIPALRCSHFLISSVLQETASISSSIKQTAAGYRQITLPSRRRNAPPITSTSIKEVLH